MLAVAPPWQYEIERFQNEIRAGLKKITPIVEVPRRKGTALS